MYCLVINCMTLNILFGAIRTVIIAIIYKTRTFNGTFFISPQSNSQLPSCNPSHGTCCSALGLCFLWQTSPWCQPHLPRTAARSMI